MTRDEPDPRTTNTLIITTELGETVGVYAYAGTVVIGASHPSAHLTVEQAQEHVTNMQMQIIKALALSINARPRLEPEIVAKVSTTAFWNELGVRRG